MTENMSAETAALVEQLTAQIKAKTPNPANVLPIVLPPETHESVKVAEQLATLNDEELAGVSEEQKELVAAVREAQPHKVQSKGINSLLVHYWDIVPDYIMGSASTPETGYIGQLSGRVSDMDLVQAEVDIAWLVKCGSLVDAGYR